MAKNMLEKVLSKGVQESVRYEDVDLTSVANGGFTLVFQTYPELLAK